jgi:PilZ domain
MSQSIAQVRPNQFGGFLERRRQPRVYLPVSVCVSRSNSAPDSHLACMRDANIRGAFFYCDIEVTIGETLYVHLATAEARGKFQVNCESSVVRVENSAANGLTGIAVEFHRFEIEDPTNARESLDSSLPNWGVENFQRMFAQRLELERCAFRIQGAA